MLGESVQMKAAYSERPYLPTGCLVTKQLQVLALFSARASIRQVTAAGARTSCNSHEIVVDVAVSSPDYNAKAHNRSRICMSVKSEDEEYMGRLWAMGDGSLCLCVQVSGGMFCKFGRNRSYARLLLRPRASLPGRLLLQGLALAVGYT